MTEASDINEDGGEERGTSEHCHLKIQDQSGILKRQSNYRHYC